MFLRKQKRPEGGDLSKFQEELRQGLVRHHAASQPTAEKPYVVQEFDSLDTVPSDVLGELTVDLPDFIDGFNSWAATQSNRGFPRGSDPARNRFEQALHSTKYD